MKWVPVTDADGCGYPGCFRGGVPCDCTTKSGRPRVYCRWTHDRWAKSHPCPACMVDQYAPQVTK